MDSANQRSITLRNGTRLFYASEKTVQEELRSNAGLLNVEGGVASLSANSDLEAGVYEGGFKVWECALDLCNYLCTIDVEGLNILELGCGAALPSILALKRGASSAVVQDFNDFVLKLFTERNLRLNDVEQGKCTLLAGEWGKGIVAEMQGRRFDLILSSETIYNEANYAPLHETMDALLEPGGKVLIAAKCFYFGVGGSLAAFEQFVHSAEVFGTQQVWTTTASSVPRKIMQMTRKN